MDAGRQEYLERHDLRRDRRPELGPKHVLRRCSSI